MFYRYQTSHQTVGRLDFKTQGNHRLQVGSQFFEEGEIKFQPPWPHSRMFRFPEITSDRFPSFRRMSKSKRKDREKIPDIFILSEATIVSAKTREIIERVDNFSHQYVPAFFFDFEGNAMDKGEYYHLWVRRRLEIEDIGLKPDIDFWEGGASFLATIQNNAELREKIEQLPLWQTTIMTNVLYLNEELVEQFRTANLVGIKEYSRFSGKGEESLGHV